MKVNYVVLDFETGGIDFEKYAISQVSGKVVDGATFELKESLNYKDYVKPYCGLLHDYKMMEKKTKVTKKLVEDYGIEGRVLMNNLKKLFKSATEQGARAWEYPVVVGHNVTFDLNFMETLFKKFGENVYDYINSMRLDTKVLELFLRQSPQQQNLTYNLTVSCKRANYNLSNAHDAEGDVDATIHLLQYYKGIFNPDAVIKQNDAYREKFQF